MIGGRTVEIIDRTDVMLQIFEQRLDQQRREIRAVREAIASGAGAQNQRADRAIPKGTLG